MLRFQMYVGCVGYTGFCRIDRALGPGGLGKKAWCLGSRVSRVLGQLWGVRVCGVRPGKGCVGKGGRKEFGEF